MLKQNSELRAQAREALRGKWPMAGSRCCSYLFGYRRWFVFHSFYWMDRSLLVGLPVAYGFAILMLAVFRGAEEVDLGVLFAGFQEYSRILTTKLLQAVYTFLWSLLLLIPGIIKHYSYAMTDYILKDEPELCNNAAIERSMAMMEGNKMKLFLLDLSFIGWAILCLFTFGIGFFFLQPYMQASHAAFYEDLKAQQGGININVEVTVES